METKKFFPYHFNIDENYDITLDGLPDIQYYGPGSMMPAERAELEEWYAINKDKIKFNLNDQIAAYCSHGYYQFLIINLINLDVKLLATGLVHMIKLFEKVTTLDITDSHNSQCLHALFPPPFKSRPFGYHTPYGKRAKIC
jgi:hypothetical protein